MFDTLWHFASLKFHGALNSLFSFDFPSVAVQIAEYFKALGWALRYHLFYCLVFVLIQLAVISIAGGSLCRITALQLARGEKPGMVESLQFSTKKFSSFFAAPLLPVGIIMGVGMFLLALGLLGNIPRLGELIVTISMPLALGGGLLISLISVGTLAGANLMYPAIAYDGSDSFDAISRSFSYIYARPWRMGFYSLVAGVYGSICYIFVRFFVFLLLFATHLFLRFGLLVENSNQVNKLDAIWPEPSFMSLLGPSTGAAANWTESLAAFLIHLLLLVVVSMIVSFIISFYFSANTIIYSFMRNKVDNTDLQDIYIPVEGTENEQPASENV